MELTAPPGTFKLKFVTTSVGQFGGARSSDRSALANMPIDKRKNTANPRGPDLFIPAIGTFLLHGMDHILSLPTFGRLLGLHETHRYNYRRAAGVHTKMKNHRMSSYSAAVLAHLRHKMGVPIYLECDLLALRILLGWR
jgi:hypothetical protein